MRVPYGEHKDYFKHSLFLVFCNRITTSAVSAGVLLVRAYNWILPAIGYHVKGSNIAIRFIVLPFLEFPLILLMYI